MLLRFSLTSPKPLDIAVALTAMVFGVLVLAIFNYFACVSRGTLAKVGSLPSDDRHAA